MAQRNPLGRQHSLFTNQRGQGMVEMLIVFPILIMLVFGILQLALVYHAKETLNYATFIAARNGALNQAKYQSIVEGLSNGLAPLFTHGTTPEAVVAGREKIKEDIANGFACIRRLNPSVTVFDEDYIIEEDGELVIPNDNLIFRQPGFDGSINIHDANLLKIEVTYCHTLIVPFVNRIITGVHPKVFGAIKLDAPIAPEGGAFRQACYENNRLPIVSEAIIRMQTSALNDAGFAEDCS